MGVPLYPFRIMAFFTYKHYGHDMTAQCFIVIFLIDCNISTAYCWSSSDVGVNQQFNTTVDEDNQYAVKLSEKP